MNLPDTAKLLAFIARCDNRRADDATAIAWQSVLGDLPYEDCLAAVRRHFATDTAYLMPAHVRRLVLQLREDRARTKPHEVRSLPSRFEMDEERQERLERGVALARAMTAFASSKAIPSSAETAHDRAVARARRERGNKPAPDAPPKPKRKPPKDFPPPQTDDVAALVRRYLRDGWDPLRVAETLGVSRKWCRQAAPTRALSVIGPVNTVNEGEHR